MKYKKQRGQKRRFKALVKNIDRFKPFMDITGSYEHFHVPCGPFISSPKTSAKIKTAFCKAWLDKTEEIIKQKPASLPFCKVITMINESNLWNSQIIIFYDKDYYEGFWVRNTEEQKWTLINDNSKSFIKKHNIQTELSEIGYKEIISDDDFFEISNLWFYGDI